MTHLHPAAPAEADHHHAGLAAHLQRLSARRQALRWLGSAAAAGLGPLALAACGGGGSDATAAGSSSTSTGSSATGSSTGSTAGSTTGSTACAATPTETAGPYPADGTTASNQRLNALLLTGIVRSDIRASVGSATGTAAGVPLTVTLTLVNSSASCAPLAGRAVYLWHCTREGGYSLYSSGITGENYLRGVQVSDANGQVSFSTIFPGCYAGRWPHIHFEVYDSLSAALDATTVGDERLVSQLALPAAACTTVYGTATGYTSSVANFANISLASDNVFGNDSAATQLPVVTGSVSAGLAAALTVGLSG